MPGARFAMTQHAGDLSLVHRVDHRRRSAGAAKHVADIGNIGDAGALAAKLARHANAQKTLGAQRGDCFLRKPRTGIDRRSMGRSHRGGASGARHQIRRGGGAQIAPRDQNAARGVACRLNFGIDL